MGVDLISPPPPFRTQPKSCLISIRCHSQAKRYAVFVDARQEIMDIVKDLDAEVVTEFEQDVIIEDVECFVLSETNMAALHELLAEVRGWMVNVV